MEWERNRESSSETHLARVNRRPQPRKRDEKEEKTKPEKACFASWRYFPRAESPATDYPKRSRFLVAKRRDEEKRGARNEAGVRRAEKNVETGENTGERGGRKKKAKTGV